MNKEKLKMRMSTNLWDEDISLMDVTGWKDVGTKFSKGEN